MPSILNRSKQTWEFGGLRVPPGLSWHSKDYVDWAMQNTSMRKHMNMSGAPGADLARFVLDMSAEPAPEPEPEAPYSEAVAEEEAPDLPASKGDLKDLSRKDLREMAAEANIDGAEKMLKDELLAALSEL